MAGGSRKGLLQGFAEGKGQAGCWKTLSRSFLPEVPWGPAASPCGEGSMSPGLPLANSSPVLQPVLGVLQPRLQVPDAHLLLLQGRQVLLRGGRLNTMVVAAQHVLHGTPARGHVSVERGEDALIVLVPWPPDGSGLGLPQWPVWV